MWWITERRRERERERERGPDKRQTLWRVDRQTDERYDTRTNLYGLTAEEPQK